jgi:hypothetical protein
VQVAVAVMLVFSVSVLLRSLESLRNENVGYQVEGLLCMDLFPALSPDARLFQIVLCTFVN